MTIAKYRVQGCCPPLHCTLQGSLEHKAWPGPYWQVVLPDWRHLLPVAAHLHGIGRAPTATLLPVGFDAFASILRWWRTRLQNWICIHLHVCLACLVFAMRYRPFRLFVEIGRPFKKKQKKLRHPTFSQMWSLMVAPSLYVFLSKLITFGYTPKG